MKSDYPSDLTFFLPSLGGGGGLSPTRYEVTLVIVGRDGATDGHESGRRRGAAEGARSGATEGHGEPATVQMTPLIGIRRSPLPPFRRLPLLVQSAGRNIHMRYRLPSGVHPFCHLSAKIPSHAAHDTFRRSPLRPSIGRNIKSCGTAYLQAFAFNAI